MPALDRVRRQRERRTGKPDQRNPAIELALNLDDSSEHVRERLSRLEQLEPIDICAVGDRSLNLRSFAFDEIERQSHRLEGKQQVGEQDGRVDVDRVDRLQRHVGGEVRLAADVEQGVSLADGAVVGHVAAGLTHEPDGGDIDRLAPACLQEPIVFQQFSLGE